MLEDELDLPDGRGSHEPHKTRRLSGRSTEGKIRPRGQRVVREKALVGDMPDVNEQP